jgi:GTPase SAR1 family protein
MADYDFSTLNSSDLEELVCDLLNLDQPVGSIIKYKTFKDGKDKGIDFLFSTSTNKYEHVGQVKHYYRTGYDGLYNVLKNTEVKNVNILKPRKYIVATSVDLSVANTESIKDLFGDFIKDLHDIYGKKDLNRLIEGHEEILNSHYKLWLSDFSILKKLLSSDLDFRSSSFVEHELKRRLRIYVKTALFDDARIALAKNRFIILTGEPGVGKTTLAEMLIYEYIAEGYNLSYILDDIKEAEKVLVPDNSKQIIYFDDFLGSNKVEINRAKGSETALRRILNRIPNMENKLVVFTTRSFLLNTAIEESENLRRFNIKAKSSLFELKEYNKILKKQLLNNHIEDSELKEELKELLYDEEIQNFIVTHSSFRPRSIEFITTVDIVNHYNKTEFKEFIISNFDYPDEIWKHAYKEQITDDDRLLLNTLISFGEVSNIIELEVAFNSRVQYEVDNNNKQREMFAFEKALKRLEGGFIILKNEVNVTFINPSLIDFLVEYLKNDNEEVLKIINSVKYISQLTERLFSLGNAASNKMPQILEKRLLTDYKSFVSNINSDFDLIKLVLVIYKYIENNEREEVICEIIDSISEWEALYYDYSLNMYFKEFIFSVRDNKIIISVLQKRIEEIVYQLFRKKDDIHEAIDLLDELITGFDVDFDKLDTSKINEHLDDIFSEYISEEVQWLLDWMTHEDEAQDKLNEIEKLVKRINDLGIEYEANTEEFDFDWYEVAMGNEFARQMAKDD